MFLLFFIFFVIQNTDETKLPETNMTTTQIIAHYGYIPEIHNVSTADDYILELHRILPLNNGTKWKNRPVVLFQHGFIGSSAVWVTNQPNLSAAFLFSDAGYDVWMGNARGNTYSNQHLRYTKQDREFWEFTWTDIAEFDLTAMIDYILNETSSLNLYYVGYSEGTLTMFAKLITDQKFAKKIRKFFALGPIGSLSHIKGLIRTLAENFMRPLKILLQIGGEFMPNASLFRRLSQATCSIQSIIEQCEHLMFQMTGPATSQMDRERIPVYMTHLPAGTSIANVLHWAQMVKSQKIQMFDLDSAEENQRLYGSDYPPSFNFSLVNAPVYLYWSNADWLADEKDVKESLIDTIPKNYLIENNQLENFNHFDFIWGINAAHDIYHPIINIINNDRL